MFELHPDLRRDCFVIGNFPLCRVLAMNDATYPWFVLVPRRNGLRELYELNDADREQYARESAYVARQLATEFHADKMNVAALGNVTPQLHIHHIVRYKTDPAWPTPVWGKFPLRAYTEAEHNALIAKLHNCLHDDFTFTV